MRRLLHFVLLACFAALVPGAHAQSAGKIIEHHVKAAGGKKALQSIRSVRVVGEVLDPAGTGAQGPAFVWQLRAPDFTYVETGDFIEAFNGRSAWREDAAGGLHTLTGREQLRARATAIFRNDRFLNYKRDKTRVQFTGRDTVAGRSALGVLLTTRTGLQRQLWFDAETHLLLMEEQEREDGPEQIYYQDYRPVGGVLEPFRLQLRRRGRVYDVAVRQVLHNAAVEPEAFDYPNRSSEPLPDIAQLLHDVQNNQKQVDALRDKYTYNVAETNIEVDGKGNRKEKSEKLYEVFYLDGTPYWKLVGENGKPLSAGDARKEQEKAEKFIREHEERKAKEERDRARGKKKEDDELKVSDFLRICRFVQPRRERFRGQRVIVFDFEPRPGYKPRNRAERIVHTLGGTLWITEDARQVARLEARFLDSFRIGGGLVASVGRGSAVVFEQELLHGEVWLPSYAEMNMSARVFLLAGFKVNRILHFSGYQRFSVESTSEIKPPAIQPD